MASVLVDLDDLSYMDEVTDVDDETGVTDKPVETKSRPRIRKGKNSRNTIIGESLQINAKDKLVQELINDRLEKRRKLDSKSGSKECEQTEKDLEFLENLIKNRELNATLKELRAERAEILSGIQQEEQTPEKEIEQIHERLYCNPVTEDSFSNKENRTEQKLSDDIICKVNTDTEFEANFKERMVVSDVQKVNTTNGSKAKSENKDMIQLMTSVATEDANQTARTDYAVTCCSVNYSETDTSGAFNEHCKQLNSLMSEEGVQGSPRDAFNGAKPKRFKGKPLAIRMSQVPNPADTNNSSQYSHDRYKDKRNGKNSRKESKKNKTKMCLELPEEIQHTSESDVKILVTNEDGLDVTDVQSPDTRKLNGNFRNLWAGSSNDVFDFHTSNESLHEERILTPLNFLRKLDEDETNMKENSLLRKQELYNQQKAKPFPKFAKIKLSTNSVSIEGDSRSCNITAITLMPDKKLVMFDKRNKCIKLFDEDFCPLDRVVIASKHCGLAAMLDNSIAVTLPESKKLKFFQIQGNSNTLQCERTYPAEGEFYAISYHHNRLYVMERLRSHSFTSPDEWQIKKIKLNKKLDNIVTLRKFTPGHKDSCLCANDYGLYLTNRIENEVLMLKHSGAFMYRHKVEYSLPMGIDSDRFGNIFVCGGSVTSFIELIKPDLRKYRIIFNKMYSNPMAICVDKEENIMYVCDQILGKVIKYRIEHNGTVHGLMKSLFMTSDRDL